MKMRNLLAGILLANIICSSAKADENAVFRDFVQAMGVENTASMRTIVQEHRNDMAIMFYVALKESAQGLTNISSDNEGITDIGVMLLICTKIAQTFDEAYPGQDILCAQFKDSRPLLTGKARREIVSDKSLARFLDTCIKTMVVGINLSSMAADLESIIAAATELPEERGLRVQKEAQDRLRAETAERVRRERLAEATTKFKRLLDARDEQGLMDMLMDSTLDNGLKDRVVAALGSLKSRQAVNVLSQLMADKAVQGTVAKALGQIGDERAVDVLLAHISDAGMQIQIADALKNAGGDRAIKALVAMLDDAVVAPAAMTGLLRIGPSACPALIDRLWRFSPSGGMKCAAQILCDLHYRPQTAKEKARLALSQGHILETIMSGRDGFSAAVAAMQSDGRSIRWAGMEVVAISLGLPAALLTGIILFFRRKWLWPNLKVRLHPDECRQCSKAVKMWTADGHAEPGSILQTLWAENRFGRRQRIKVEIMAGGEHWEIAGHENVSFVNTTPAEQAHTRVDDVLISVGHAVRPGTYLARERDLSVRIRVVAKPA